VLFFHRPAKICLFAAFRAHGCTPVLHPKGRACKTAKRFFDVRQTGIAKAAPNALVDAEAVAISRALPDSFFSL